MSDPSIDEAAKAIAEVAKASGKALDVARDTGGFLNRAFGELIVQTVGTASDWVTEQRLRRVDNLTARNSQVEVSMLNLTKMGFFYSVSYEQRLARSKWRLVFDRNTSGVQICVLSGKAGVSRQKSRSTS